MGSQGAVRLCDRQGAAACGGQCIPMGLLGAVRLCDRQGAAACGGQCIPMA